MPQRILVVEDEPGIRLALKDELQFEGFDVELAEDGPTGLAAILRSPPDLIVLDLPIKLDLRRHCAFKGGIELQLTDTEFRILALLLERPGEVITRDDFLKHIWGEDVYVTHRTVDTHVAALRKKIEDDLAHPAYILSVRNVGCRLDETITHS